MDMHELTRDLVVRNDEKIVMLVADGLGGLPLEPGGKTELETARTPHLDALAKRGVSGGSIPVKPGITPGSGPGHLGLFGYDPLEYRIGRGVLEATGIGFELGPHDVAARGNYCTLDAAGKISDRRAGRIGSEESAALAVRLRDVQHPGRRSLCRAGQGTPLRGRVSRRGLGRRRPRHRSAGHRRASAGAAGGEAGQRAHGRSGGRVRGARPEDPGRREKGQRPDTARFFGPAQVALLRGSLRTQGGGHRGLSDVQGPGPAGRHGHRRQGPNARRADRSASSRTGASTISSSSITSTPTARARTASSTSKCARSKSSTR